MAAPPGPGGPGGPGPGGGGTSDISGAYTIPAGTTSIAGNVYTANIYITSITIPASVTSIEANAFTACSGLTAVIFESGSTLATIGNDAFYGCSSLTSFSVPASVTSIGNNVFQACSSMTSVTFVSSSSLTTIGDQVFASTGLTSVTIPASVQTMGSHVFDSCTALSTVVFDISSVPVSLETSLTFGTYMFNGCTALTTIHMPPSMPYGIASYCFSGCTALTSINIPAYGGSLQSSAFLGCTALTTVVFDVPNPIYAAAAPYVGSIEADAFTGCTALTAVSIPDSVTTIGTGAFYGCSALASVTINTTSSLTTFGSSVFSGCTALRSILLPSTLRNYGTTCFQGCSNLAISIYTSVIVSSLFSGSSISSLTFGSAVTQIPVSLANGQTSLTSVTIQSPSSMIVIGTISFEGCTGLTAITIPASVRQIAVGAFNGCSALASVAIDASSALTTIGANAFNGTAITSIQVPSRVTSISTAFNSCASLTSVTFQETAAIKTIASDAFYGCTALNTVHIPSSLTSFGTAFRGSTSLSSLVFNTPSSITDLSASAFQGCTDLTFLVLPASLVSIGSQAFYECTSLASLTIDASSALTTIGQMAFSGCVDLQAIALPASLVSIGVNAFAGCTSLASVSFPAEASLTTIGNAAFMQCQALTSFRIPDTVTSFGAGVFSGCSALESLTVGCGLTSFPTTTVVACTSLATVLFNVPCQITSLGANTFTGTNIQTLVLPSSITSIDPTILVSANAFQNLVVTNNGLFESLRSSANSYSNFLGYAVYGPLISSGTLFGFFSKCIVTQTGATVQFLFTTNANGLVGFVGPLDLIHVDNSVTSLVASFGSTTLTQFGFPTNATTGIGLVGQGSLTKVVLPSGCATIDVGFAGATLLQNINVSTVTSFCTNAFLACSSLKSVSINAGVTQIPDGFLSGCTAITAITIPSGVTSIGLSAFYGTAITSVTIPSGVTTIGESAFGGTGLSSVVIPNSVTSLGATAFQACTSLSSVTLGSLTYATIGASAFTGTPYITSLCQATVPTNLLLTPSGETSLVLSWSGPTDLSTNMFNGYNVFVNGHLAALATSATQFTVDVSDGTLNYSYQVMCNNILHTANGERALFVTASWWSTFLAQRDAAMIRLGVPYNSGLGGPYSTDNLAYRINQYNLTLFGAAGQNTYVTYVTKCKEAIAWQGNYAHTVNGYWLTLLYIYVDMYVTAGTFQGEIQNIIPQVFNLTPNAPTITGVTAKHFLAQVAFTPPTNGGDGLTYNVYMNGSLVTLDGLNQIYTLTPNTSYTFQVAAVNFLGVEGPKSSAVTATTAQVPSWWGSQTVTVPFSLAVLFINSSPWYNSATFIPGNTGIYATAPEWRLHTVYQDGAASLLDSAAYYAQHLTDYASYAALAWIHFDLTQAADRPSKALGAEGLLTYLPVARSLTPILKFNDGGADASLTQIATGYFPTVPADGSIAYPTPVRLQHTTQIRRIDAGAFGSISQVLFNGEQTYDIVNGDIELPFSGLWAIDINGAGILLPNGPALSGSLSLPHNLLYIPSGYFQSTSITGIGFDSFDDQYRLDLAANTFPTGCSITVGGSGQSVMTAGNPPTNVYNLNTSNMTYTAGIAAQVLTIYGGVFYTGFASTAQMVWIPENGFGSSLTLPATLSALPNYFYVPNVTTFNIQSDASPWNTFNARQSLHGWGPQQDFVYSGITYRRLDNVSAIRTLVSHTATLPTMMKLMSYPSAGIPAFIKDASMGTLSIPDGIGFTNAQLPSGLHYYYGGIQWINATSIAGCSIASFNPNSSGRYGLMLSAQPLYANMFASVASTMISVGDATGAAYSIPANTFYGCSALTSFPCALTGSIGASAFQGCAALPSLNLSLSSPLTIGGAAFQGCTGMTSLSITTSSNLTIAASAFQGCTGLTSITISCAGTLSLDPAAFTGCTAVTSVTITDGGQLPVTFACGGFAALQTLSLTFAGPCTLTQATNLTSLRSVSVTGSAVALAANQFSGCSSLQTVTIGPVATMGGSVFGGCSALQTVAITFTPSFVGNMTNTFSGLTTLRTVTMSGGSAVLTMPSTGLFAGCTGLTSVNISGLATAMDATSFGSCNALTSLQLGWATAASSVNFAPTLANRSALVTVAITGSVNVTATNFLSGASAIQNVTVNGKLTGSLASGLTTLRSITITYPTATAITAYQFANNTVLRSAALGPLSDICDGAFFGCTNLANFTFPAGLLSIGDWAFANTGLTGAIVIPSSVTSLGTGYFVGCPAITSITYNCDVIMFEDPTRVSNGVWSAFDNVDNQTYLFDGSANITKGFDPSLNLTYINRSTSATTTLGTSDLWKSMHLANYNARYSAHNTVSSILSTVHAANDTTCSNATRLADDVTAMFEKLRLAGFTVDYFTTRYSDASNNHSTLMSALSTLQSCVTAINGYITPIRQQSTLLSLMGDVVVSTYGPVPQFTQNVGWNSTAFTALQSVDPAALWTQLTSLISAMNTVVTAGNGFISAVQNNSGALSGISLMQYVPASMESYTTYSTTWRSLANSAFASALTADAGIYAATTDPSGSMTVAVPHTTPSSISMTLPTSSILKIVGTNTLDICANHLILSWTGSTSIYFYDNTEIDVVGTLTYNVGTNSDSNTHTVLMWIYNNMSTLTAGNSINLTFNNGQTLIKYLDHKTGGQIVINSAIAMIYDYGMCSLTNVSLSISAMRLYIYNNAFNSWNTCTLNITILDDTVSDSSGAVYPGVDLFMASNQVTVNSNVLLINQPNVQMIDMGTASFADIPSIIYNATNINPSLTKNVNFTTYIPSNNPGMTRSYPMITFQSVETLQEYVLLQKPEDWFWCYRSPTAYQNSHQYMAGNSGPTWDYYNGKATLPAPPAGNSGIATLLPCVLNYVWPDPNDPISQMTGLASSFAQDTFTYRGFHFQRQCDLSDPTGVKLRAVKTDNYNACGSLHNMIGNGQSEINTTNTLTQIGDAFKNLFVIVLPIALELYAAAAITALSAGALGPLAIAALGAVVAITLAPLTIALTNSINSGSFTINDSDKTGLYIAIGLALLAPFLAGLSRIIKTPRGLSKVLTAPIKQGEKIKTTVVTGGTTAAGELAEKSTVKLSQEMFIRGKVIYATRVPVTRVSGIGTSKLKGIDDVDSLMSTETEILGVASGDTAIPLPVLASETKLSAPSNIIKRFQVPTPKPKLVAKNPPAITKLSYKSVVSDVNFTTRKAEDATQMSINTGTTVPTVPAPGIPVPPIKPTIKFLPDGIPEPTPLGPNATPKEITKYRNAYANWVKAKGGAPSAPVPSNNGGLGRRAVSTNNYDVLTLLWLSMYQDVYGDRDSAYNMASTLYNLQGEQAHLSNITNITLSQYSTYNTMVSQPILGVLDGLGKNAILSTPLVPAVYDAVQSDIPPYIPMSSAPYTPSVLLPDNPEDAPGSLTYANEYPSYAWQLQYFIGQGTNYEHVASDRDPNGFPCKVLGSANPLLTMTNYVWKGTYVGGANTSMNVEINPYTVNSSYNYTSANVCVLGPQSELYLGNRSVTYTMTQAETANSVYSGASNLTIIVPSNVTAIPDYAFSSTDANDGEFPFIVQNLYISPSVTSIGANAFYRTTVQNLFYSSNITSIGARAFYNSNLVTVTAYNASTTTYTAPAYVTVNLNANTTILYQNGTLAFIGFTGASIGGVAVTSPVLSVEYSSSNVFLTNLTILDQSGNSTGSSTNLYIKFGDINTYTQQGRILTFTGKTNQYLSLYDSVSIQGNAVASYVSPVGTQVSYGAGSGRLYQFNAATSQFIIPNPAFVYTSGGLSSYARLGARVASGTTIGANAFAGNTSLQTFTFPADCTSIGANAFSGTTSLAAVHLPDSVTTIGDSAFAGSGLTQLTLSANMTSIGNNVLQGVSSGLNIVVPSSVPAAFSQVVAQLPANSSIFVPTQEAANAVTAALSDTSGGGGITIKVDTPPGPPSNVMATASSGRVSLSWNASDSSGGTAVVSYTIDASGSDGSTLAITGVNGLSHTISGLVNRVTYSFSVYAVNANGLDGDSSDSVLATPLPDIPGSFTGLFSTYDVSSGGTQYFVHSFDLSAGETAVNMWAMTDGSGADNTIWSIYSMPGQQNMLDASNCTVNSGATLNDGSGTMVFAGGLSSLSATPNVALSGLTAGKRYYISSSAPHAVSEYTVGLQTIAGRDLPLSLMGANASSDTSLATFTINGTPVVDGTGMTVRNATSVTVVAIPTDPDATVTVMGDTGLTAGSNHVTVSVIAADGTTTGGAVVTLNVLLDTISTTTVAAVGTLFLAPGNAAAIGSLASSALSDLTNNPTNASSVAAALVEGLSSIDQASTVGVILDVGLQLSATQNALKATFNDALVSSGVPINAAYDICAGLVPTLLASIPSSYIESTYAPASLAIVIPDSSTNTITVDMSRVDQMLSLVPGTTYTMNAVSGGLYSNETFTVSYNRGSPTRSVSVDGVAKRLDSIVTFTFATGPPMFIQFKALASPIVTTGDVSTLPICFLGNAPVLTPTGYRRIDSLRAGDKVMTADGRAVAIQAVERRITVPGVNSNPYIVPKGTFGATETLAISPRHRIVTADGMVEARALGLTQMPMRAAWCYYNLRLPSWRSDNLVVAGVETESLAPVERVRMSMAAFAGLMTRRSSKRSLTELLALCKIHADGTIEAPVMRAHHLA